jgi:hypothetical protein
MFKLPRKFVESSGIVLVDVTGIEPATPCLQSVDDALVTESYAVLSGAIYAASSAFSLPHALLLFATIFDFGVHQLVHQADARRTALAVFLLAAAF